jgi:hypothetical protein
MANLTSTATSAIPAGYSYDASGKLTNNAGQVYIPPVTPAPITPTSTPPPTTSSNPADPNYNPASNYNIPKTTPQSVTAPFGSAPSGVPYGGQNSNNPNPDSSVYGINGSPVSPNSVNSNGLTPSQQEYEDTVNGFSDKLNGIINGTTPLTASEEAQIQGLQTQYQQLIDKQNLVNTNNSGTANIRGYETGAAEYDPTFQQKTIGNIVSAGQTQIANLQTTEASAVAQLTESMQQNDVKGIQAAYDMYTSANKDVSDAIAKTVADTQQAIQDANIANVMKSGITDPSDILSTLQSQGYTDVSLSDITTAIKNLSPDAADIYSTAQTATADGANPDTVALIMAAPDKETALKILAQSGVANTAVNTMMAKYPDAEIVPGDTVEQANAKVQASPTYTMAQKSAALDLVAKQANIDKTFADIAAETVDPNDVQAFMDSLPSANGTSYITPTQLEGLTPKEKSAYKQAAQEAGVPMLAQKDADALTTISTAQQDLADFNTFITTSGDGGTPILPKNWFGQPQQLADVTWNSYLQTNSQLSAYNTRWKLAVIPVLSALKGTGSGGGGGAARLFSTIGDLFPSDTDTIPTAEAKINHINTLLQNAANAIVPPKNTSTYSGVTLPGGSATSTGSSFNGITLPH